MSDSTHSLSHGDVGYGTDTISIGRYAESKAVTFRSATGEEATHFEVQARQAYGDFVTKAAASRNMSVADLEEVLFVWCWY